MNFFHGSWTASKGLPEENSDAIEESSQWRRAELDFREHGALWAIKTAFSIAGTVPIRLKSSCLGVFGWLTGQVPKKFDDFHSLDLKHYAYPVRPFVDIR